MGIQLRDHKMLWGRAGNRCAFPNCRAELVYDNDSATDRALIGEECHIVGRGKKSARSDSDFALKERDAYGNLILMCRNHHKTIDDLKNDYSVDQLLGFKTQHEAWVHDSLSGFDSAVQNDDEQYARIVDEWVGLAHIDEWKAWTSYLLGGGQPCIDGSILKDLECLREWMLNRVWPRRYEDLENAFTNFRLVLSDLINLFTQHSECSGDEHYTKKYYQIDEWNPTLYRKLLSDFEFHVDLIMDLTLELTRAGNYIGDIVRSRIKSDYGLKEGVLLVDSGPGMDLTFITMRLEYGGADRISIPYPGLKDFKATRSRRDHTIGVGTSSDDPKFLDWNKTRK